VNYKSLRKSIKHNLYKIRKKDQLIQVEKLSLVISAGYQNGFWTNPTSKALGIMSREEIMSLDFGFNVDGWADEE